MLLEKEKGIKEYQSISKWFKCKAILLNKKELLFLYGILQIEPKNENVSVKNVTI